MRRAALVAVFALLVLPAASAPAQTMLTYTVPTLSQPVWKDFDPETGDSIPMAACDASGAPAGAHQDTLRALDKAFLWYWPPAAGGRPSAPADSHSVANKGGPQDTFPARGAGLYWITITNKLSGGKRGASCTSNEARIYGNPTGVGDDAGGGPVIIGCRLYSITGALVSTLPKEAWYRDRLTAELMKAWTGRRLASGIYFMRCLRSDGRPVLTRRVIILR